MTMKNKILTSCLVAVLLSLSTAVIYLFANKPKTAYIDMQKVFSSFQMKKELESKLTDVEQHRKNILDSMELHLRIFSGELDKSKEKDPSQIKLFNGEREDFFAKQKQFEQDNSATQQQYMDQVSKQLSQYVNDYGKQKGYEYIFGADGSGILMHADDSKNITEEVTGYINERYKGGK